MSISSVTASRFIKQMMQAPGDRHMTVLTADYALRIDSLETSGAGCDNPFSSAPLAGSCCAFLPGGPFIMRCTDLRLLVIPAGLSLIGCQDQPPTGSARNVPSAAASTVTDAAVERPDEAEMAAFARAVPGLGGYYFGPEGELVVNLTAAADPSAAQAALAALARRGSGRVRTRPASYTFLELQAWRDALVERIVEVSGVTFLDLDEVANRVVIGIAAPAAASAVLDLVRSSAIPVPAVRFERAGYAQSNALEEYAPYINTWPTQGDSITSYRRPLEGGLKIAYRRIGGDPDNAITCTPGFTARLNGVRVAITASHCSQRHWVTRLPTSSRCRGPAATSATSIMIRTGAAAASFRPTSAATPTRPRCSSSPTCATAWATSCGPSAPRRRERAPMASRQAPSW
jgi:hypothetical protein